jgi:hypothetical protein
VRERERERTKWKGECLGLRAEAVGEWIKRIDETLYSLYSSINITEVSQIKKDEIGGARSTNGERWHEYKH